MSVGSIPPFRHLVSSELARAKNKFPEPKSIPAGWTRAMLMHYWWGVIAEEFKELQDEVFSSTPDFANMRDELVQLAAMCHLAAESGGLCSRDTSGFWYLATPYKDYVGGEEVAFQDAKLQAAHLMGAGIPTYSPIVHNHNVEELLQKGHDYDFWVIQMDLPMMQAAAGLVVCMLPGWDRSKGIAMEIGQFVDDGRPVVYMEPGVVPKELISMGLVDGD